MAQNVTSHGRGRSCGHGHGHGNGHGRGGHSQGQDLENVDIQPLSGFTDNVPSPASALAIPENQSLNTPSATLAQSLLVTDESPRVPAIVPVPAPVH